MKYIGFVLFSVLFLSFSINALARDSAPRDEDEVIYSSKKTDANFLSDCTQRCSVSTGSRLSACMKKCEKLNKFK